MTTRIEARFRKLRDEGRPGLVTFIMAGDPDGDTTLSVMRRLPEAGADVLVAGTATFAGGQDAYAGNIRRLRGA